MEARTASPIEKILSIIYSFIHFFKSEWARQDMTASLSNNPSGVEDIFRSEKFWQNEEMMGKMSNWTSYAILDLHWDAFDCWT